MISGIRKNKWSTALMSLLFLFVSSGFSLSRMTCLHGGHSILTVGKADDCCPVQTPVEYAVLKSKCCAVSEVVGNNDPFTPRAEQVIALSPVVAVFVPVIAIQDLTVQFLPRAESSPPPLLGQERLVAFSTFLI